jgi:hypothetical protein
MVILIDRDILSSFCSALGVSWEIISDAAALFFTADSPRDDYVYCAWDPATGGAVRLEMSPTARTGYIARITDALVSRRQRSGVKGREKEVWKDEVTALIAMLWLLRA